MTLGDRVFETFGPIQVDFVSTSGLSTDSEKNEVVLTLLKEQIEFRQYHQQVDGDMG